MIRDSVTSFAQEVVRPQVRTMDETGRLDRTILSGLFEQGLFSIDVPMEHGGSGASFTSVCLAIEALSRVDPTIGLVCDLQNTVINSNFLNYANDEIKRTYFPKLTHDTIGSFCLSEPDSGSDAFALRTTATKSKDGTYYTLNGQKAWISNAEYAGVFLVFANVDPSKGYKGITCFVVDEGTPGFQVGTPEAKLGIRASSTCPIFLSQVRVPATKILGKVGQGYKIAIGALNEGRIGIASQMLGLAQGAFDLTMPYLFERKQFGKCIGDFQAMEHQYAELALEIQATRLLTYHAARLKDTHRAFIQEAAMAKLQASRVAEKTASKCIELLGGAGFTVDWGVEKLYRDAKVGSIYEGTSNMQLTTIAKAIQAQYR